MALQILLHCTVNEEEQAVIPHRIIGRAETNFLLCVGRLKILAQPVILISGLKTAQ